MLMGASARVHEGESLQSNMYGLYKATNPMRVVPAAMRRVHRGLKFVTSKTVKRMPESVQNVTYHVAWLPINVVRSAKNAVLDVVRAARKHISSL